MNFLCLIVFFFYGCCLLQAQGKIVVFNQQWEGYFDTYMYRSESATRAAKVGAVAVLVRSLTQLSIYSPHTGVQVSRAALCIKPKSLETERAGTQAFSA